MITEKDIKYIANLSDIYIKEDEIPALISDMENIIAFAEGIKSFDCGEDLSKELLGGECSLREDEALPSYPADEILMNAPLHKDGYILLRKSE